MPSSITICYIRGDGVGEDIWNASHEALEEAVLTSYRGDKRIEWVELQAGQRAFERSGHLLPHETLEAIREKKVAIKGPLTTPVGGGFRSINVHLRQIFDLYACLRPIRYLKGSPSPLKRPEKVDFVIVRENTEDLYRGIEWEEGADQTRDIISFLSEKTGVAILDDSGIGLKPISKSGTRRIAKWAIEYAIRNKRRAITVVHKGNIMKFTEGAFRKWAYEVAEEYPDEISFQGADGKILFNDRIADNMFMQAILRPEEYDVLLCPNLNGDYLSDACAGLIGGLGVAPGANIGDDVAIFEPSHGSAPKYAGKDVINPTSFLLSGAMMLSYVGLPEAGARLEQAVESTMRDGIMTYDLARQTQDVKPVGCSAFGDEVKKRIAHL